MGPLQVRLPPPTGERTSHGQRAEGVARPAAPARCRLHGYHAAGAAGTPGRPEQARNPSARPRLCTPRPDPDRPRRFLPPRPLSRGRVTGRKTGKGGRGGPTLRGSPGRHFSRSVSRSSGTLRVGGPAPHPACDGDRTARVSGQGARAGRRTDGGLRGTLRTPGPETEEDCLPGPLLRAAAHPPGEPAPGAPRPLPAPRTPAHSSRATAGPRPGRRLHTDRDATGKEGAGRS